MEHPYQTLANRLTRPQCKLLMEHIDGAAWIDAGVRADFSGQTRLGLIRLGMLEFRMPGGSSIPRFTYITPKGRSVLACVLSNYADALIAAGYHLIQKSPLPTDLESQLLQLISVEAGAPIVPQSQNDRVAVGAD